MRILILFIALLGTSTFFAQDAEIIYLDNLFRETNQTDAAYVQHMQLQKGGIYHGEVHTQSEHLKMKGTYTKTEDGFVENGLFTFYYASGSVESVGEYVDGFKSGSWKRYTSDGRAKPERYYDPELAKALKMKVAKKDS